MTNNYLWLILLFFNYFFIAVSFRLFKKNGMFAWIALSSILANIQVVKTIELFGFVTTLGNIMYGTSFLATDILSECYGEKDAHEGVKIGIFSILATTVIMQLCILFIPHESDITSKALHQIFSLLPRIAAASIVAYLISQTFDVWFYNYLKQRYQDKLWLRNNLSTMVSQLIDNTIFTFLAFWGVFPVDVIWQIFVTTYMMKWLVALLDTPVIYWAARHYKNTADSAKKTA